MSGRLSRLALAVSLLAVPVLAQEAVRQQEARQEGAAKEAAARVPFGVGEVLEYDVRFKGGFIPKEIHVGNGTMEVLPMDTVRGMHAWHTVFRLSGGIPLYRVNDRYEAWMDSRTLASLRYWQIIDEGNYEPRRHYEIYPDRRVYTENEDRPSVEHPLDEASFLYFLRTIPLRVGMDTSFNDYFRADRNPVRVRVVRRDTINVGAGRFAAIVVQPSFESKLFREGGHAEVWLSDDSQHIMLQMKSKVNFGSLNIYLKSYRLSPTASAPLNKLSR